MDSNPYKSPESPPNSPLPPPADPTVLARAFGILVLLALAAIFLACGLAVIRVLFGPSFLGPPG